ncbi:hypothetical protein CAT59_01380 [Acinetobacter pittii]|uniref:Uncharacterized protein n=1 Tax=Acinetobacter pittii TaxID=48296 RepID=A0A242U9F7_ACIPI|nr:hypothetical protein J658_0579 [Acinetobacter baumannii 573719]MBJ8472744.1 hypothetical protein [Acinetobacter pittii]MCU4478000.1 hypothetical protein [Acinetobacter sp. WU_MDCI_Abxd143]MBJ8501591.1 hypothetical protein [Acinetobacter pittii]MBJ9891806.1 hypothetical protein [Acinetobacter pittii]
MNFYTIYPSEYIDRDFSFDLKEKKGIIVDYFKFDLSDKFLKNPRINLDYENIFSDRLNEILETDFYYSSSGILLFSKRFFNEMKEVLAEECDFYRCYVRNQEADIYAIYIKRKNNLLDEDDFIKNDLVVDDFFIARDTDKPYIYVVSKKFVDIVKKFKFKINFLEY